MTMRTVNLQKGDHAFVFRYAPGCEGKVVTEIMCLARDSRSSLDWLDAAKLGFQGTQRAASDFNDAICPFLDAATDPSTPKFS